MYNIILLSFCVFIIEIMEEYDIQYIEARSYISAHYDTISPREIDYALFFTLILRPDQRR